MNESPVQRLVSLGQSPWLDFIQRGFLEGGEFERLIEQRGVRGVTSNPVIFEKAIDQTEDYRADIARLAREERTPRQIYESLAIEDVRRAAELLSPVHRATNGADGFVSLEVSPHLAHDGPGTVAEARRIWSMVERPNLMIKVPGTREGLSAIRSLLGDGINVNVTLLFSIERYREVLEAYQAALDDRLAAGRRIDRIASVASFFLSRIDTLIDRELDALAADPARSRDAQRLRGQVAIASARVAYAHLRRSLESERFRALRAKGARPQRLLWASTSAKDPAYSPVKYIEPLIGPDTVNTMPLETLDAYHESGHPAVRLSDDDEEATAVLAELARLDVDLDAATAQLLDEGIKKFADPYDALLESLGGLREAELGQATNG